MLSLLLGIKSKDIKNGRIMFNGLLGKGFIALRVKKKRYGITTGKCFRAYHFGLKSYYFELNNPKRYLGNTFGV